MKNFKKYIVFFILPILLLSCGFAPMYKNLKDVNFVISIKNVYGDRDLNNLIKSQLKSYTLNEENKNYDLKKNLKNYDIIINSDYEKVITAKDTTGAATNYKITITTTFTVTSTNYENEFTYKENFDMQNFSDRFEEKDYEKNIKDNLTNIITRKLILQLFQNQ
tara:strand:- start:907 stop:1398 length:492 start_codon:yes stop_codon:yes gene_type:complete